MDDTEEATLPALENLGLLLSLASARGVAAANAMLRPLGLNSRSYTLLELVIDSGGASQRELADAMRLDPSQIVALVDALEDAGLAERCPKPEDRRQKAVVATSQGRRTYRRARTQVDASLDEVLAGLDSGERETLHRLLARIVEPMPAQVERAG